MKQKIQILVCVIFSLALLFSYGSEELIKELVGLFLHLAIFLFGWIIRKYLLTWSMMKIMYSNKGLDFLRKQFDSFKAMTVKDGTAGIVAPFHPGAVKLWKEKGVM